MKKQSDMKNFHPFSLSLILFLSTFTLAVGQSQQEATGLPGDHFSLEGALELFKKAASPEDFEKALNSEDKIVNNLDLNEDGQIDYIRVIDNAEGDVHALVLQAVVSETESQDIAVIEIEKNGPQSAMLQIIGDEDIFGESLIVEPFEEEGDNGGHGGAMMDDYVRVVVNVYGWTSVRFVYAPGYSVWRSPYYYGYYPRWWRPWRPRPFAWFSVKRVWYPRTYHRVTTHRVVRAHRVYTPRRTHSVTVRTRYATSVTKYRANKKVKVTKNTQSATLRKGNKTVKARKSTTTVSGKKGNKKVQGTRTTKSVRANGKRGGGKAKSTKTKVRRKKN
jgi:hypothetical protein